VFFQHALASTSLVIIVATEWIPLTYVKKG